MSKPTFANDFSIWITLMPRLCWWLRLCLHCNGSIFARFRKSSGPFRFLYIITRSENSADVSWKSEQDMPVINTNITKRLLPAILNHNRPEIGPIGVYITIRALQKPIRYTAHHFEERTAAPLVRCRNWDDNNISYVNRCPIPYDCCIGRKAIRYNVNMAWKCT